MPEPRYALILLKGYGLGHLTVVRTVEPLSKDACESMLTDLLTNPPIDTRFGGACVRMRGEWLGSYAVERRAERKTRWWRRLLERMWEKT